MYRYSRSVRSSTEKGSEVPREKQTSKQNQHQEQNTPKAISKTNNNKNNNKKAKTEFQYCMAAMSVTWAVNIVSLRFERQAAISQSAVTDKTHE